MVIIVIPLQELFQASIQNTNWELKKFKYKPAQLRVTFDAKRRVLFLNSVKKYLLDSGITKRITKSSLVGYRMNLDTNL